MYLFAVQDTNGREVCSWKDEDGDVAKVGDVEASRKGNTVTITNAGTKAVSGTYEGDSELTLHRWNADDKLATPVSHPVAVE